MLDPRCPYTFAVRAKAAHIVGRLAGDIHLEELPRGIHCITSLLNEEYCVIKDPYQRDWLLESRFDGSGSGDILSATYKRVYDKDPHRVSLLGYGQLAVRGQRILHKLASDEVNCRVMSNTQGLVSKITEPLSSDKLHRDQHDEWSGMATATFRLLALLIEAPGEAGEKLRCEISNNTQAISAMENTLLMCDRCFALQPRKDASGPPPRKND
jgi:hypothetical protein